MRFYAKRWYGLQIKGRYVNPTQVGFQVGIFFFFIVNLALSESK